MVTPSAAKVATVRAFNRFYTGVIGVLEEGLNSTSYSLTEARVLFELAQQPRLDVVELRARLGVDAGYLTRILGRLTGAGLVTRERSTTDARKQVVALTANGKDEQQLLDDRASEDVVALLQPLPQASQQRLVDGMDVVRHLLDSGAGARTGTGEVRLRDAAPGDLGWVVQRNGEMYAAEFGWDASYEVLVAGIVADFARDPDRDPARERVWIAEVDGTRAGCVFCVRGDDPETAKLRLLLVEPTARGLGLGSRLVDTCVTYARTAGYRRLVLWTNDVLVAARRVYQRAGFTLVDSSPHVSFGKHLVGETWSLDL